MDFILRLLIFLAFLPKTETEFGHKCPKIYNRVKMYWVEYLSSYIREENGTTKGPLPKALKSSLHRCCSALNYSFEKVAYVSNGYNQNDDQIEVENETLTLLFPILDSKGSTKTADGYQYLPIKTSPGPMVLADKKSLNSKTNTGSTFARLTINPGLILLLTMAVAAAVLFWILEFHKSEKSSSPFSTFISEIGNSFWFTVVTMTTVGYGDLVPRYPLARCCAVTWMFLGTVLISFYTAHISSTLTAMQINDDKNLIGRKLGVLYGTKLYFSSEINFGATIIEYSEPELFQALRKGNVSRILLPDFFESLYAMSEHNHNLEDITIVDTIKHPFAIGLGIVNDENIEGAFIKCWSLSLKLAFSNEQKIDYSAIKLRQLDEPENDFIIDGFLRDLTLYSIAGSSALFVLAAVKMMIEQQITGRLTSTERQDDGL